MHDITTLCMFVQLQERKRQMAAQEPVSPAQPVARRAAPGAMLAAVIRRLRAARTPAVEPEASR